MNWSKIKDSVDGSKNIFVDGHPVWDYKELEGKLRLISEPVEGSENYERVTVDEISEYLGLFTEIELISETDGTVITEDRIACN